MASTKQREAARTKVKKAQAGAKEKGTLKKLYASMRKELEARPGG
jgi:hypothetical protein